MIRPWKTWVVFGLCACVLAVVMAWMSLLTWRLEDAQRQAIANAQLEERVRLALWRMDSSLAPLMIEESARPADAYESFHAAGGIYSRAFTELKPGEVLVASPLLGFASSNVVLHFQLGVEGNLTSPEVPTGNQRDLAETRYAIRTNIEIAAVHLERLRSILGAPALGADAANLRNQDVIVREASLARANALALGPARVPNRGAPGRRLDQELLNFGEQQARANVLLQSQQVLANSQRSPPSMAARESPDVTSTPGTAQEGILRPLWLGEILVLARRVDESRGGTFVIQGCWLNWAHVRPWLLGLISDLLPGCDLETGNDPGLAASGRTLAMLPVRLVTGAVPPVTAPRWTAVRLALAIAWGCGLLAMTAAALLLHGALALSERRAAFVSAVTHELRTPLTTFKMYSEMLAGGMVTDEAARRSYLATLCAEAERLSHLVGNVLAFARLERGRSQSATQAVSFGELIERVKPRLLQRTEQSGLRLVERWSCPGDAELRMRAEVSVVEQILFNLVDNACKYAGPSAADRTVHVETARGADGRCALIHVRDHGPGISPKTRRLLFKPFSKSAAAAARSAPGVGLGLALCRRLSRSLGGDLYLENPGQAGACFVLKLPVLTEPGNGQLSARSE